MKKSGDAITVEMPRVGGEVRGEGAASRLPTSWTAAADPLPEGAGQPKFNQLEMAVTISS